MRRILINSSIIFLLVLTAVVFPHATVKADSTVTTYDMINMVNSIRTGTYGLPALVENSFLDEEAQWTADTMAAMGATDHLAHLGYPGASERAANMGFGGGKTVRVTENWAYHKDMTISILQEYWSDTAHMYPMTESQYTYVGAGISSANGETYYVLQAGVIDGETAATASVNSSGSSSNGSDTQVASNWLAAVATSTPEADGSIWHVVQPNQFIYWIAKAYGVSVDSIVQLNNLSSADDIYAGLKLKIKDAPTATPTSPYTPTSIYPTRTPTSTPAPVTPTPFVTATLTPVPPFYETLPKLDQQTLGLLLVILSGLGLLTIVFFTFFKPTKKSPGEIEPVVEPETAAKPKDEPASVSAKTPAKAAVHKSVKAAAKTPEQSPADKPAKKKPVKSTAQEQNKTTGTTSVKKHTK